MFVHRFNLPFPFWFINCRIQRAPRLCYCCCPLAVCLGQLRLILSGVDWTLQMSAYNLLIPFISLFFPPAAAGACMWIGACAHMPARARGQRSSKAGGDERLHLCVGNESISFAVSPPERGSVGWLAVALSDFSSHILVAFPPLPYYLSWLPIFRK